MTSQHAQRALGARSHLRDANALRGADDALTAQARLFVEHGRVVSAVDER